MHDVSREMPSHAPEGEMRRTHVHSSAHHPPASAALKERKKNAIKAQQKTSLMEANRDRTFPVERPPPAPKPPAKPEEKAWKLELRRTDMSHFDESETKTFKRLLRKLVQHNSKVLSIVEPVQPPSNDVNNHKRKKRKVITRRDANGVILEKIVKPYDGDEGEDIIIKYSDGVPVSSFKRSELQNGESSKRISSEASKYPRRKRKQIYDESELDFKKSKLSKPASIPESAASSSRPSSIVEDSAMNKDCEVEAATTEVVEPPPVLPQQEPPLRLEASSSVIPQPEMEAQVDHSKMEETSSAAGIEMQHPQSETVGAEDTKEPKPPDHRPRKPKFSAKTKLQPAESDNTVDFNYFDINSGSYATKTLLQTLMTSEALEATVDPYDLAEMFEEQLGMPAYRDELSSSSDDATQDDADEKQHDAPHSSQIDQVTPSNENRATTKSESTTAAKKKKPIKSKKRRKRRGGNLNFDSEDESAKALVNKISSRYKTEKESEKASARPTLRLPEPYNDQGADFKFLVNNPGEDSTSRQVYFEQVSTQLLNQASKTPRNEENSSCAFCRQPNHHNSLGPLFGPYFNSPQVDSEEGRQEFWFHHQCAVWAPGLCMVGSQLHGVSSAMEIALENKCVECGLVGATLGCIQKGCALAYHYACAVHAGCNLNQINYSLTCTTHSRHPTSHPKAQEDPLGANPETEGSLPDEPMSTTSDDCHISSSAVS